MIMLKHLYKTALIAFFGVLSFQESFAQCPSRILPIMGDTVCSNSTDAYLKISNTKVGDIFQAFLGAVAISSPIVSSGIDVLINVKVYSDRLRGH
jgi:hypothetical protein